MIDPNLARAIVADAGVAPGDRVAEVGAGLGSLTLALAATGAQVRAIEFDRALIPALEEAVEGHPDVVVVQADAMAIDWRDGYGDAAWTLCANLPYQIAVPIVMSALEEAVGITPIVVMVQREVGERLAAGPGDAGYGAVSVRVAYLAASRIVRRVPPSVFWPRPKVESVVIRLDRRTEPPVPGDRRELWRVIEAGFAERRKTMRNALIRLGLTRSAAGEALAACGVSPNARAEELDLATFAALTQRVAP